MPVIVGIGAAHSGLGKTYFACGLISALVSSGQSNVGAIKVTPEPLYASIIDDPLVLRESGKDTALMIEAGVAQALWVRGPFEVLAETLESALGMLGHRDVVVVEGNSAIEVLRPDIVIFIKDLSAPMKPGGLAIQNMADVIIYDGAPGSSIEGRARKFSRDETREAYLHVLSLVSKELADE